MRLKHVISLLNAEPDKRFAIMTQYMGDKCMASIAIRGLAAFEMEMPAEKYDAWNLITTINRHGGGVGK